MPAHHETEAERHFLRAHEQRFHGALIAGRRPNDKLSKFRRPLIDGRAGAPDVRGILRILRILLGVRRCVGSWPASRGRTA